jgi:hypothetical protein
MTRIQSHQPGLSELGGGGYKGVGKPHSMAGAVVSAAQTARRRNFPVNGNDFEGFQK